MGVSSVTGTVLVAAMLGEAWEGECEGYGCRRQRDRGYFTAAPKMEKGVIQQLSGKGGW